MKPNKNKQKVSLRTRLQQRISLKEVFFLSTGLLAMTAILLVFMNTTNPLSSQAKGENSIKVIKVTDQVFTTDTSLDQPEIIQDKINSSHTILIRDRKIINAQ